MILGTTAGRYTENEGTNKTNNRVTHAAASGTINPSLLKNSGFEHATSRYGWWRWGDGSSASSQNSGTTVSATPRTGNSLIKVSMGSDTGTEYLNQTIYLQAGATYVFSGYVNTACAGDLSGGSTYLSFRAENGGELAKSRKVSYKTDPNIASGWERLEVAYTVTTSAKYHMSAILKNAASTVVFDDFQLEKVADTQGIANTGSASSVNLLQSGSFDLPDATEGMTTAQVPTWWSYTSSEVTTSWLDAQRGYGMAFAPGVSVKHHASQTVNINGSSNRTYILSGWGQTPASYIGDGKDLTADNTTGKRFFGMMAAIKYSDTSTLEYHYVPFNDDLSSWQYASGMIVPKRADKTISTIKVITASDYLPNRVYIDDVALMAEPVQTYTYDDEGNLLSTNNSEGQTSSTHDAKDRLTKYTGLDGVSYTLTYSGDSRDPATVTGGGVKATYTYDAAGNVTAT